MDQQELLLKAKNGDIEAFELLFLPYDKEVLNTAVNYVDSAEDAKEIYLKVFTRARESISAVDHNSDFSGWILGLTNQICTSYAHQ
jgi:RNA polymerase sigma-70 factor (ECF subfamily)